MRVPPSVAHSHKRHAIGRILNRKVVESAALPTPVGFASTILPVLRFRRRCHRRARRRGRCLHQTLHALLTLPFLLATKNVRNIIIVAYVESHTTVTPLKQGKTYDVAASRNKRR